jgi:hypothetical protein
MKKLRYIIGNFKWLRILNSPFKLFEVKWYVGKTRIGTPYFLPRKWVKATPELAKKAALEAIEADKKWNESNPKYVRKIKSYEDIYQEKLRYRFPVPLKIGFSYCGLGWKTKWRDDDYRYEWGPVVTFVFFGYQIAMMIGHKYPDQYWTSWLYYEYQTEGTRKERVKQCREKFPKTYTTHQHGATSLTTDYYRLILKEKYLK